MKFLLSLFLLLPLVALGQGTSIRSLSGLGTNTTFYGTGGGLSLQVTTRLLYDIGGVAPSLDYGLRRLKDGGGTITSYDWDARIQYDVTGVQALDHGNRLLKGGAGTTVMDWAGLTFTGSGWVFLSITNHSDVSAGAFVSGGTWGYDGLTGKWTNGLPATYTAPLKTNTIASFTIYGAVATGGVGVFPVAGDNYTISGWSITAVGSAPSVSVDIWKRAQGATLPTVSDTILGATKPTLNSGNATNSTALTGWLSSAVVKGDIWGFNVDTVSGVTNVTLQIFGYR